MTKKQPSAAAQAAIDQAKADAVAAKSTTKPLEGDAAPMPRATDKQVRDAKKKAEAATRVTDMVIEQTKPKRAGRRQTDPVVKAVSLTTALQEKHNAAADAGVVEHAVVNLPGAYQGPMLALRQRLKAGHYQKAANGQPSCGDEIAQILGQLSPTEVIKACMLALDLAVNPYPNLNIGQQSMNLRNKLRGAIKKGMFGMGVLREAVEEVIEARPAPVAESK